MPVSTASSSRRAAIAQRTKRHQYAILLSAELTMILVYPFFIGIAFRDELFRLMAVGVFGAALYAVLGRGRITTAALILGTPAILMRLLNALGYGRGALHLPDEILGLAFMVYVTIVIVWTIVSDPSVTADTLAGAVSAYLLIGITFGLAYTLIEGIYPGSFKDTVEPGKHFLHSEFTFFSFVTLTTVGYGDIVPWNAHARSLAIIESVIGIMYPAVLISRLVGMHGSKHGS